MIALLIASYIVLGYLNVLLECRLDQRVIHPNDALFIMILWPVLWAFLIVGGVCWVFGTWIPQLCAGKR